MTKKKYKEKDILEICWEDSVSSNRWQHKNDYLKDPNENYINHKSVGYLLNETSNTITIMQSYGLKSQPDGDYATAERQMIPKKCITKIRRIT